MPTFSLCYMYILPMQVDPSSELQESIAVQISSIKDRLVYLEDKFSGYIKSVECSIDDEIQLIKLLFDFLSFISCNIETTKLIIDIASYTTYVAAYQL